MVVLTSKFRSIDFIITSYLQKLRRIFRQVDFTLVFIVSGVVSADISHLIQFTSKA